MGKLYLFGDLVDSVDMAMRNFSNRQFACSPSGKFLSTPMNKVTVSFVVE
jgi:hypothetical protein